ncbi:MAG: 50S ribosomal protein L9 [Christensenellaceae bacterium]|jgi:large subunit ribosomal protein L9|nr:50S ribosomal protein L9 [Christensenellaceae bacterium]
MQIYLLKDLKGHGKKGDIVTLNDGYAKNFVIKNKIGQQVDNTVMSQIKSKNESEEFRKQTEIDEINQIIKKLAETPLTMTVKVGANGKLFGSITATELSAELLKHGITIDKRHIMLTEPIKAVGAYKILVKFPHGLTGTISLFVEV